MLDSLEKEPKQGKEILPDVYKMRIAISGKTKGKRGGARLIFYYFTHQEKVILMYVYDKSEISDIPEHEIKAFVKQIVESLESEDENKS